MNILNYCAYFEALGFEKRLKVFEFILSSGKEGVAPRDIIKQFGVDSGTLDFHLKKLEKVGLVIKKNEVMRGYYCASPSLPLDFRRLFQ